MTTDPVALMRLSRLWLVTLEEVRNSLAQSEESQTLPRSDGWCRELVTRQRTSERGPCNKVIFSNFGGQPPEKMAWMSRVVEVMDDEEGGKRSDLQVKQFVLPCDKSLW